MPVISQKADAEPSGSVISATGQVLSRHTAFRFALDPTQAQVELFLRYAGAARFVFNHHLDRVQANLNQRRAEASYGIPTENLTSPLSWSPVSFINAFNHFKNGKLPSSPVAADGTLGLCWRDEVRADVFECASVNAAQALANFSHSRSGIRKGKKVMFPKFKSRHRTTPTFTLRNRYKPARPAVIRIMGPKALLLPKIGSIRVHGCTKRVRRMLQAVDSGFLKPRSRASVANGGLACRALLPSSTQSGAPPKIGTTRTADWTWGSKLSPWSQILMARCCASNRG